MLTLSEHELKSDLWRRIEDHLKDRLQRLREQNDVDADEKSTATQRGRIAEIKQMLRAAEPQARVKKPGGENYE